MELYCNKIIVAPMVRVSTLPFRLQCLDYGADLIYTEETIDFKMLRTSKRINDLLGTTDFVDKSDGSVIFRTCTRERTNLIFQIGTCNAQRALKVAKLVENHVAGIDINMGCPKEFSIKGGMGAALLTQPEKIKDILSTLTSNLSIPVTCKIRILPTFEETLLLCKLIESCGVAALAIHGRTRDERPKHANHNDVIKRIAQCLSIPVIANGGSKEMESLEDIENFRIETGSSSVMVARAAMWNCSIFRKQGKLPIDTVIRDYLKYCIQYENTFTYTKYTIQNILRDLQCSEMGKAFLETQTLQEISSIWNLKDYFNDEIKKNSHSEIGSQFNARSLIPKNIDEVNPTISYGKDGCKNVEMPLQFIRGNYADAELPKMILNTHVFKNGWAKPEFSSKDLDRLFISEVLVENVKYCSSIREKNKRYSEQGAALVCLHSLGLVSKTYGFVPMEGTRKYINLTLNVEPTSSTTKENGSVKEPVEKKLKVLKEKIL